MNNFLAILYILSLINVQLDAGPIKNDQPPMPYDYEQTQIPVAQTLKENPNPECHLKCPQNEYCLLLDNQPTCHCPQSISFFRINSQCREMYAAMPVCDETLICKPNEDCVTISIYAKEGTCQCSMGYRRDLTTFECKNGSGEDIFKERRRPTINEQPYSSEYVDLDNQQQFDQSRPNREQELMNDILKKVSEEKLINIKPNVLIDNLKNEVLDKETLTSSTLTTPTTITKTTTTTATTTTKTPFNTDAPKISTKNLIADAGENIHIYYPSKSCILNGTLSRFSNSLTYGEITWKWTKLENSPAFGKFVGTNEAPVVYYENLVEGVYRFVLVLESSSGEFSQDTVDVFVHSSYITESTHDRKDNSTSELDLESLGSRADLQIVYDNLIQIELNYRPEEFTQFIENDFITRLEILLKKSDDNFNNPKVILTNTRISSDSKTSQVILEFFVCEDISTASAEKNELNILEFKRHPDLEEDMNHDRILKLKSMQNIINSSIIVKQLKIKSLGKLIDSTLEYINKLEYIDKLEYMEKIKQARIIQTKPGYNELRIIDVSLLTCKIENFSTVAGKCSKHGKCDHFTGKCVCDKYWMPNLFLYYLQNEHDLTSGNNCEWNVLLVTFGTMSFCLIAAFVLHFLLKYIFYYVFCCCLCCSQNSKKMSQKVRNKFGKGKYRSYNENKEDESDSEKLLKNSDSGIQKKPLTNIFCGFRNAPKNSHKYALLEDQEDIELIKSKNKRQNLIGNKFKQRMGDELDSDCDDAVFDIQTSPKQVKEYKNLI